MKLLRLFAVSKEKICPSFAFLDIRTFGQRKTFAFYKLKISIKEYYNFINCMVCSGKSFVKFSGNHPKRSTEYLVYKILPFVEIVVSDFMSED